MKKLLCLLGMAVLTASCDHGPQISQPHQEYQPGYVVVGNSANAGYTHVIIVEAGGHRFALAQGMHECAICEVTDASLVKTNAERP